MKYYHHQLVKDAFAVASTEQIMKRWKMGGEFVID